MNHCIFIRVGFFTFCNTFDVVTCYFWCRSIMPCENTHAKISDYSMAYSDWFFCIIAFESSNYSEKSWSSTRFLINLLLRFCLTC